MPDSVPLLPPICLFHLSPQFRGRGDRMISMKRKASVDLGGNR
jgi:hypothetical protein